MKTLRELLAAVAVPYPEDTLAILDRPVSGLTCDSRQAGEGMVFFALAGSSSDGHQYVEDALDRGCLAAVVEKDIKVPDGIAVFRVQDARRAYGLMAAGFYGHPGREMNLIGLTGTNGKTTTSWIIERMLREAGRRPGVIGTVNYRYTEDDGKSVVMDAPLTTPEPVALNRLLRQMADAGVTDVVMEVSSHALAQQRLAGMLFDVGVFTNLSRDHLDYHHTMEEYFQSKCRLFLDHMGGGGTAVVVTGDPARLPGEEGDWGRKLELILRRKGFAGSEAGKNTRRLITCGFDRDCLIRCEEPVQDIKGLACRLSMTGRTMMLRSKLIGLHNALNLLAAAGVGRAAGLDSDTVLKGLAAVDRVPGRLERVVLPGPGEKAVPDIFVDYAHTPDALENVLLTLRQVSAGRLFCIFGCGGDRDRGKRPLMGEIAGRLADRVMATSDNPRSEDPLEILLEIEAGLRRTGLEKIDPAGLMEKNGPGRRYAVLADRRQAIHLVCSLAREGDVVLIAGKGHETYQITAGTRRFFDDRLEAANARLRWTPAHLLKAASGTLERQGDGNPLLGEVSTDSRTLQPGDIFIALRGERFDGHDFLPSAAAGGAGALVVSEVPPEAVSGPAVIKVADTLRALGDLALYRRRALDRQLLVIGITGSSGKTTVKEMTAAVFEKHYATASHAAVLKTQGNLNNLVGLPLSLLRLNAGHRAAVMEMGMNRPGEIGRLAGIARPDIGCITNVQAAHLEGLGTIDGVARAKGELFAAMSGRGYLAVNYDDRHIRLLGESHGDNVIGFAVTPAGRRYKPAVRATRIVSRGTAGMRFTLRIGEWRKRITVPATGFHNVANCAAAAAIAVAAGIEPEVIAEGLAAYTSGDKRLQISSLPGGIHMLNDAYNANPSSMEAALRTVMGFGSGCRRIAVLGDMLELGEASLEAHRRIGFLVAELGFDFLAATGGHAGFLAEAARRAGMPADRIMQGDSTEKIAGWLAALITGDEIRPGDWILVKGSRGMRMENVIVRLEKLLGTKAVERDAV
jgi:murE/murF fusion protein